MIEKIVSKQSKKLANFVLSNTYISGFYKIIDEIAEKVKQDKFQNIILVVPDKFSLNAEQIFMERTGLSSVFNVWLTTLSRLVNKVVSDDGKPFAMLTKNSGTMLVSQIIAKNKDKIKTYKKITTDYSLAETMFNVINLLKSSGVKPEELKNNFDGTNLGLKLEDIYLVYSEYEKALKDRADTITRLQIFDEKIKNNDYIKNSHIYFAMFESFTNVQEYSLANLAKQAKSITISLCANTKQKNAHIFDNTVFARLKATFEDENICCLFTNVLENGSKMQKFLSQNLFSLETENKLETSDVKLLECANINDEIRYVASKIKFLIMQKKYDFDDINIAVNGLDDYNLTIKKVFDEFDFSYYIDSQRTMLEHFFTKTVFKTADFVCGQKTQSNAIAIVDSPLFDIDTKNKDYFKNFCKKYNVLGDEFYSPFNFENSELAIGAEVARKSIFEKIQKFEQELFNSHSFGEIKQSFLEFLENISAKEMLEKIANNQTNIIERQIDGEIFDKFLSTINECDEFLTDEEMTGKFFLEILKSLLSSTNLLTVPLKCGSVFVGDASVSTYYPRKILFSVGSVQGRMPVEVGDSGTITDSEIAVFKSFKQISPTIKEINKREKFKLFNLMCLPSDRLELTFSNLIGSEVCQKSEFVRAIQAVCTTNGKELPIEKYENEELKIFDYTNEVKPAFLIGTVQNGIKIANKKTNILQEIFKDNFADLLNKESQKYLETDERFALEDPRKFMFLGDKTKISQIEKYFNCPFLQFVDYAIKPKENIKFSLRALDVGNILHRVAEIFVSKSIKNNFVFDDDITNQVEKIFDDVMKFDDYKNFLKNTYAVKSLKAEAVRFCEAIKHQILCSDFVPTHTEKKFADYMLENNISISGIVDRIDVDSGTNSVRIVDYKTGKDRFDFSKVYYGIKLQLVVYLKIISELLSKNPVSTAYMPVRNSFGGLFDDQFENYKMDGIALFDDIILKRLDKTLLIGNSGECFDIEFKKSGEPTKNSKKRLLSRDELTRLFSYSFDCLNGAVEEILEGYINPKPIKHDYLPCDNCKYKSVCHYEVQKCGYRKFEQKEKEDF